VYLSCCSINKLLLLLLLSFKFRNAKHKSAGRVTIVMTKQCQNDNPSRSNVSRSRVATVITDALYQRNFPQCRSSISTALIIRYRRSVLLPASAGVGCLMDCLSTRPQTAAAGSVVELTTALVACLCFISGDSKHLPAVSTQRVFTVRERCSVNSDSVHKLYQQRELTTTRHDNFVPNIYYIRHKIV